MKKKDTEESTLVNFEINQLGNNIWKLKFCSLKKQRNNILLHLDNLIVSACKQPTLT